jgi:glutamyl-tRNA synthetase
LGKDKVVMVRTRFAPSPTGYLHIGGVRTALFNWLFARRHGGQFILRIDDTDAERNVAEALQPILDGFRWLGIDWDEGPDKGGPHGPYYQSQKLPHYQAAVQQLLEKGLAYWDYSTGEEQAAEKAAAKAENRPFVYSRRWRAQTPAQRQKFQAEGRTGAVRLTMPREGACRFVDHVRGQVEVPWINEQDVVVQKADGSCLYNLASVVDDHDMKITHVIRAEEHLANTPRQIFIAQGLGYDLPEYAHLPFVAEPAKNKDDKSKNKLSKRKLRDYLKIPDFAATYEHGRCIAQAIGLQPSADTFNPVVVDFYREVGYLPEAILNYLLLLGWSLDDRTEDFSREDMIRLFSLARVNKDSARFDVKKLDARFQARYMLRLPLEEKVQRVLPYLQKAGLLPDPVPADALALVRQVVEAAAHRIEVAGDILQYAEFFVPDDRLACDEAAFDKHVRKPPAPDLLRKLRAVLAGAESFDPPTLEGVLQGFAQAEGVRVGQVNQAVRVAVTGKATGFGTYETLAVLGKPRCLPRIDRALARLSGG